MPKIKPYFEIFKRLQLEENHHFTKKRNGATKNRAETPNKKIETNPQNLDALFKQINTTNCSKIEATHNSILKTIEKWRKENPTYFHKIQEQYVDQLKEYITHINKIKDNAYQKNKLTSQLANQLMDLEDQIDVAGTRQRRRRYKI